MLKKLRTDPAISSAPFVATLVDVTGLIIYFTVAILCLEGHAVLLSPFIIKCHRRSFNA